METAGLLLHGSNLGGFTPPPPPPPPEGLDVLKAPASEARSPPPGLASGRVGEWESGSAGSEADAMGPAKSVPPPKETAANGAPPPPPGSTADTAVPPVPPEPPSVKPPPSSNARPLPPSASGFSFAAASQ